MQSLQTFRTKRPKTTVYLKTKMKKNASKMTMTCLISKSFMNFFVGIRSRNYHNDQVYSSEGTQILVLKKAVANYSELKSDATILSSPYFF
jgi:hypothetical protein